MGSLRFSVLLLGGLLAAQVGGCGVDERRDSTQTPSDSNVLRRGNPGDPGTLDPSMAEDVQAFSVLRDLYEGLVTESADGSLIPGVASSWDISNSGRTYTFRIRDDATWSNGETVSAEDFVASFRRTLSPNSQSPYAFLLSPILHADAARAGERPLTDLGVHAVDSSTIEFNLESPTSYFLGILAMPVSFPVYLRTEFNERQFSDPEQFIGNGPYVLKERNLGSLIRLERNKHFRDAGNVNIRVIDYIPVVNPDTEYNMYRAGELDITATVPPDQIANIRRERPQELLISPSLALYYIAFDLSEAPMNDVALRQALSLAVDREALIQLIGRGERAAFGIVPEGTAGYTSARYDWQSASATERESGAQKLYAAAGYSTENPLSFTLIYDVGDIHETVALALKSMWQDVLGAEVVLDKREWKYFLDTRENRSDWQAMRFVWFGDYNDASTFLDIFQSDNQQNLSGISDSQYDELVESAAQMLDPMERAAELRKAEFLLLDAYPIIPLYFYVSKHLVSPAIKNYEPNVLDVHQSRYIEFVDMGLSTR